MEEDVEAEVVVDPDNLSETHEADEAEEVVLGEDTPAVDDLSGRDAQEEQE